MSTKTKDYKVDITAVIITSAVVRSSDTVDKVKEYTANSFMQSMGTKGIGVTEINVEVLALDEEIIMPAGQDPQNNGKT